MVKNLNQLKKALKPGTRFEITGHCRPVCIGQIRVVTLANTQGFYSGMDGQPEHEISKANGGKGSILWWNKAPQWDFENGLCSFYGKDQKHTEENLILSFRILEEAA